MINNYSYFINRINKQSIVPKKAIIKRVTKESIDNIIQLQNKVIEGMEHKEYLYPISKEEIEQIMDNKDGYVYGYFFDEELIAFAIYLTEEENLCTKIGMRKKALNIVNICVKSEYRGNKIQSNAISIANILASKNSVKAITAYVHPDNKYSLKTMMYNGLKIKKEVMIGNENRRYIMLKEI